MPATASGRARVTESGPHVLVVDDEPQILRGLPVILRSAGFQVVQAATKRYGEETHDLRVHFANIRRKLERDPARPEIVLTDAGVGYRLAPEP